MYVSHFFNTVLQRQKRKQRTEELVLLFEEEKKNKFIVFYLFARFFDMESAFRRSFPVSTKIHAFELVLRLIRREDKEINTHTNTFLYG